ncbi:MAG: exodeoxyribonuclease VII large subunit, partial [Pirellulales bacterium]|nr:exodeoxyribonuclease VII large subunit [Pirellulales bacterium]
RGVIWRSTAQRLKTTLEDGQAVICHGDLEVYAARGSYQLVMRKVQMQGIGALQLALERLQARLNAEGLFAVERKRRLPAFPQRVAVVTSPSGAAIHDFLQAASHRWQGTDIVIIPSLVQGEGAAQALVAAIDAAHQLRPRPDVLLLTRGGGSLEDLWCFNEERLVRAVAASQIPTVSAVGHEVDVTLCDLAADLRALTPTDGATKILPDSKMVVQLAADLKTRLHRAVRLTIGQRQTRLEALAQRTAIRKPHELVHLRWRHLDELDGRARRAVWATLQLGRANLAASAAALDALSPLNVLGRGYSVTIDSRGNAIGSAADVAVGETITTRLRRGSVRSTVVACHENE